MNRNSSLMPQIGFNHDWIAANILRSTLGNDASFREDQHARAKRHDEFHLVLDHDKRCLEFGVVGVKPFAQMAEHGQVYAPRRLVEQDEPRACHEGHRSIQELLLAVTQRARLLFSKMRQAKELDHPSRGLTEAGIGAPE